MAVATQFEVWAYFCLSRKSEEDICSFFADEFDIPPDLVERNMHLTVYHARRPMFELQELHKPCRFSVDTMDFRFMVMAPGGENPRPELDPGKRKVGVRIIKSSPFRQRIYEYRNDILEHENGQVLGNRKPSNNHRNAFGARHFQPHITLLRSGTYIDRDLTIMGDAFRDAIPEISFSKYVIKKRKNF